MADQINCPKCPTGNLQETFFEFEGKTIRATGCNKCDYGIWMQIEVKNG